MNIGILTAQFGKSGLFYMGKLDYVNMPSEMAIQPNPQKSEHKGAADFKVKILDDRKNWATAGGASWKENKEGGKRLLGRLDIPGRPKIWLTLFASEAEITNDETGETVPESFDVSYSGGGSASRKQAPSGGDDNEAPF